jgi:hypothetical protein
VAGVDRTTRTGGLRFLLAFAGWATLAFFPAWWVSRAWQHALAAVAARLVAPSGTELEMLDLELFYPIDLAVFIALCVASGWTGWARRRRALLVGTPIMVLAELLALAAALAALLHAGATGGAAEQSGAMRLADGLIRVTGLGVAAVTWYALLGRERFDTRP